MASTAYPPEVRLRARRQWGANFRRAVLARGRSPAQQLDGSISLHPELRTRPTQPEMSGVGWRRTDAPEEASARPPRAEARHAFLRGRLAGDEAEVLGPRGAAGDGCRQARARSRRRAGEPGEIARHFGKANGLKARRPRRRGIGAAEQVFRGGKKVSPRGGA